MEYEQEMFAVRDSNILETRLSSKIGDTYSLGGWARVWDLERTRVRNHKFTEHI